MFTSVSLVDFKCFKGKNKFVLKPITLLAGFNGTGKSSVCQSLLMIAQSIEDYKIENLRANGNLVNLGLPSGIPCVHAEEPKFGISWSTDAAKWNNVEWEFKAPSGSWRRTARITGLKIDDTDMIQTQSGFKAKLEGKNEEGERTLRVDDWNFLAPFDRLHYIGAERLGPALFERRADISRRNPIGSAGEHKLEILSHQTPEMRERIAVALSYIMNREIKIEVNVNNAESDVQSLWFEDNGVRVNCVNTGFGFTYVLSLLVISMTERNSIIIIENPEAHLHSQAQSRLMTMLAETAVRNNNQFIIESHSENIMNGLSLAVVRQEIPISKDDIAIHFFGIGEKPRMLEIDENGQISPRPKGFFTQEEEDIAEILEKGLFA